jgi:hypothetical protein
VNLECLRKGELDMASDTKAVFISYRRDAGAGYAGRIGDTLVEHFGEDKVFRDIDSLEPGLDFAEAIERAIESSEVLIAVIGKNWLTATDEAGQKRLENPVDYVRTEIATALKRNIRVIPLLIQGADMPSARELPDDLAPLSRRNAFEIHDSSWRDDIRRLVTALERAIKGEPVPSPQQQPKQEISLLRLGLIVLFPALIAIGLFTVFTDYVWLSLILPLPFGLWLGIRWRGRHPKMYALLGLSVGVIEMAAALITLSIRGLLVLREDVISLILMYVIGATILFFAGGLFGDLIKDVLFPGEKEEPPKLAQRIAKNISGPNKEPNKTLILLIQALGPSVLALLGTMVTVLANLP